MKSGISVFGLVVLFGGFISVARAQTPEILAQPTNQVAVAGSAVSFSVAASGAGPLTYQWQFNGTNLPSGLITTVAGNGTGGYSGDGSAATNAELLRPFAVAVDGSGSLFIADSDNNRVRKVATNGIITTVAGGGRAPIGDGGAATNAQLGFPYGVAVDASGSLFIAENFNSRVRKVGTDGIITTVAGNGTGGYSGDGGPAASAELNLPYGVAVDASGNLFIADSGNNRVRKVGTNGIITTVAGNGNYGYSGDGHAATNAAVSYPAAVAMDASGNLFIASPDSDSVRKVGTNGIITTVAGNGNYGYSGDGLAATHARLSFPYGVAVDGSGNLFIADSANNRVRKVGANGIIATVAGNGTGSYSGDGRAATSAELNGPNGVAVDASGILFIADSYNQRIRKVVFQGQSPALALKNVGAANAGAYDVVVSNPSGSVTSSVVTLQVLLPPAIATQPLGEAVQAGSNATLSVAASGTAPLDYQWYFDGAPLAGQTNTAWRLSAAAFTNAGSYNVVVTNLYGTVTSAAAVLYVGIAPGITAQPAGQTNLFNGTATFSVAVSGSEPLTYQWQFNGTDLPNRLITTVAGNGTAGYSGNRGAAINAELNYPYGVAVDASGNLFIADQNNNRIRKLATNGVITTVAGNGTPGYSGDGGAAASAELNAPLGVALDASGNLFIADWRNFRIRKVSTNGIITTAAGNGIAGYAGDGHAATSAELYFPAGVAVDGSGNLFIVDSYNRIREVGTNGIISTLAGNGTSGDSGDGGPALSAELHGPRGPAVDASGNVYFADSLNQRIREVGTNGIIATVAGNGTQGYSGDGGAATNAELNFPAGVALDGSGNLFIADSGNDRVRQVATNGIITTAAGNGIAGFSGDGGTAANASLYGPQGVAVDGPGNLFVADEYNQRIREAALEGQGPVLVLNNVGGANAGAYDVVVSNPCGTVTSRVVALQVFTPPALVVQPQSQAVALGSNATFSVSATGTAPLACQWYFDAAPLGGQTNTALLLSAAAFTNAGAYNVVLTNLYGSVTSVLASLSVGLPPAITTQPVSLTNFPNTTAAFSVAVSGTGPFSYQWQFDGGNLSYGAISAVAGNAIAGYSGDGGPATDAELSAQFGVAMDASGNLFIADYYNNRVRKVDTNGIITTVAGIATGGYSGDGGPATNAQLSFPAAVALDASGNLFIADYENQRIRRVGTNGIITTVAGNGTPGYSGDGGAAASAQLDGPYGVALDASGNLFIADWRNFCVRKVAANGVISTVAGNGIAGYAGDGSAATNAELYFPAGVALDASGNLFIADYYNNRIREVGTNGVIATVAGNGTGGYSADGVAATTAELNLPAGVAVDASGNLFIADSANNRVREVDFNGVITTAAGNGTAGYTDGNGGTPTFAEFSAPVGVALDAAGNLFVADQNNHIVRKVPFPGRNPALVLDVVGPSLGAYDVVVSSLFGSVTSSVATLQLAIPPALVTQPQSQWVVMGSNATVSVAATGAPPLSYQWYFDGARLRGQTNATLLLSAAGSNDVGSYNVVVTNLYGSVTSAAAVVTVGIAPAITAGPVSQTNLLNGTISFSVAVSGTGPLTYQWQFNGANLPRALITTVAGTGTTGYSGDGGAATNAELSYPYGVALDASGNLFLADQNSHVVRKVGTNGIITTVAGNGTPGYSGDSGAATEAELSAPSGVAVDASGNLFIADQDDNVIREVGAYSIITTAAGNGTAGYSGDGGVAGNAELAAPAGVAVEASGNLFIADQNNNVIREVGAYGLITTVAGNGIGRYSGDGGRAASAELFAPAGVAVDASGDLFIADRDNFCIRKVIADAIITTVAGNGTPGYSGDGGAATEAELSAPSGVAVDASGNLFIADSSGNRVREVGLDGLISTVAGNGTPGYSGDGGAATEAGLSAPSGVAVDASGNLLIADPGNHRIRKVAFLNQGPTLVLNNFAGGNAGAYDVVVSSPYGSVTSRVVTLQVPLSPVLVTQPQSQTVTVGGNATLRVAATGSAPLDYQWYFDGTPLRGQTNATLLLSAAGPANAGSYYVVVTNLYGSITSAAAVLSLLAAPSITVQPVSQAILPSGTATFSVAVSGTGPFTYQWQFNGANLPNRFITTAAGNGTAGYSGDGGPAASAELNDPFGVALDASGNLFIADAANSCIRKVGADGIISTVAGSGVAGYAGDGGPATAAQLWFPYGVAVDASGNLFIPDWFSCRVRKVGTSGIITTVAGNGTPGYSGDGGAAANAQLQYPYGVAADASGNLFIADSGNNVVRKVSTDGIIATVAGNGTRGYSGDGRPAASAELNFPAGVAVDAAGILFIADENNNCVRKVGTDGIITTAAGNGFPGYSGDGGPAASAELDLPYGVAVDASANLFVADSSNNIVREVGIDGTIATVAGDGTPGYSGDGGAPANGELNHPTGVAVDASGNLFIADQNNNVIREVFIPGPTLVLNNVVAANAGAYDVVVSNPYGSVTSSVVTLALALPPLNARLVGRQAVQLQFQGTPGGSYLLLSATDLTPPVDWLPVITNVAGPSGDWTFTDTNVPSTHARFYRMSTAGQ